MNGMTYMRGSRKDYDDWAKLGNVGWSYRDVLPYFIRSEDNQQVNSMDYGYHGVGGPLTVMQFPYHPPLSFALLDAGRELGMYMTVRSEPSGNLYLYPPKFIGINKKVNQGGWIAFVSLFPNYFYLYQATTRLI